MLQLLAAQIELLAARHGDAKAAARAESSALKGLATKGDSIELWIALARAHLLEVGNGGSRGNHLRQARAALWRAKHLSSDYPPVKALGREVDKASRATAEAGKR